MSKRESAAKLKCEGEIKTLSFDKRLENLENIAQDIHKLTVRAKKKRIAEKDRPTILPFSTKEDLLLFDNATNDEYNAFVDYLTYLGGVKVSLKDTRFTAACEEAMSNQENLFTKPDNREFTNVMTKALKSAKERFCRKRQAEAPVDESKTYKRRREGEERRREEVFNNEDDDDDITLAPEEEMINADEEEMRNADEEEMRNDDEEETRDTGEEDYRNEYSND
ncbi:hypothetical protein TSAR_001464 [Trichomalopsis sarcophagae]|uniref:Uncharacterized protein n=1 Tax=Trichomalopsis sarcophagae TaxID=543379 RepID=A0A232EMD3_9HYME|nr:hypothetical protein TSAR_001464 [Trichomalopsis sarcophagae]